jgi:hypothetical protein
MYASPKTRIDNYQDWLEVGQILKNCSDNNLLLLNEWIRWSKNSKKFQNGICEQKWKTFKKTKDGLKLGSLLFMLKQDNVEKFNEIKKKLNIKKIIMDNKNHFPNNDLDIIKIITGSNLHYVGLSDTYCPILQSEHNGSNCYIEINKHGDFLFKCVCDTCRGKEYPINNSITLSKTDTNYLFNITNNNNINITFNESGEISSDKIKIDSNSIIFENDDKEKEKLFNKLMIDSLSGTDSDVSKVIFFLCENIFSCTQDKKWYKFINHRWQESDGLITFISDELINYYIKIIKFINDSQLEKSEKNLSIKEVKKVLKILKTKSNISNIVEMTGVRFREKNKNFFDKLDTKPYLIGFDNGIYDLDYHETNYFGYFEEDFYVTNNNNIRSYFFVFNTFDPRNIDEDFYSLAGNLKYERLTINFKNIRRIYHIWPGYSC